jgi:hypothetical protein
MLEILKKNRIFLRKYQIKKWSNRNTSNKYKTEINYETKCILNLLSGIFEFKLFRSNYLHTHSDLYRKFYFNFIFENPSVVTMGYKLRIQDFFKGSNCNKKN